MIGAVRFAKKMLPGSGRWRFAWALLLACAPWALADHSEDLSQGYVRLQYEASIAGAPAGTATVAMALSPVATDLATTPMRYRLVGQAKAEGLLDAISPWKSNFWVSGLRTPQGIADLDYRYIEQGRNKQREVRVQNRTLRVVKNGRQRPERPALPGLDVLSALFAVATCPATLTLHTGRHGYALQAPALPEGAPEALRPDYPRRCRYTVTDDDQDRFEIAIEFETLAEVRVPARIEVSGALTGVLALRDSAWRTAGCATSPSLRYLCGVQDAPAESPPADTGL
jgi:hypothetical protein